MPFLLILPLALFAVIILLVAGATFSVEIAERRRARLHSRRRFRPVVIEGGKGKIVAAEGATAPVEVPARPIRLVRSAPL
jgi:hypothetical protein